MDTLTPKRARSNGPILYESLLYPLLSRTADRLPIPIQGERLLVKVLAQTRRPGFAIHFQELLALRFAAQLSSTEIAKVVGKSPAAVKNQLTRLLHTLKEAYDEA